MNRFLENVGVYATYKEVFGTIYKEERLIDLLSEAPLGGVINILSQLNSIPVNNKQIRADFNNFLIQSSNNLKPINNRFVLFSKQGLLSVWKWVLTYCDESKIDQEIHVSTGCNFVLYINLIISDYLHNKKTTKDTLKYEMFTNAVFNTHKDVLSSLVRASVMFDDISKQKELFYEKEYLDLNYFFKQKYGYSIKEYLSVIFCIFAGYTKDQFEFSNNWIRNLDYFTVLKKPEIAHNVLNELSISLNDAKEWSKKTLKEPWEFTKFRQKPLLKLNDGRFLPISVDLLHEQIFNELYFKIRHAFPGKSTQVISFFGRCFEKYMEVITEFAVKESTLDYKFIPEFSYGLKNSKRSPDIIIKLGNKLLAIEAKVHRLKMDSIIGNSNDAIDTDIHRMAISPINQLSKRVKELIDINHPVIDGADEIYLMSVTFGDFPTLPPFEKEIKEKVEKNFSIPVKGHYHLNIEEYEILCELLSRKNASPIFKYLDNYLKVDLPFKNFVLKSHLHPKRLKYIKEKFDQQTYELTHFLFEE
ncbi:hypothetical protein [Robertmurraya sp. P23]|uniref:hypothetical protein n=1 Tax=Robertmurraya sp. P23 TaxID=3436931 RepID=UPI003D9A077C